MGGKHHRGIDGRRIERRIAIRQIGDSKIDLTIIILVLIEPIPSLGKGLAVHGIIACVTRLVTAHENNRPGLNWSPHAIQASKTLTQGIETRALSH